MVCYKFAPGTDPYTFVFPTDRGWFYLVSFNNQSSAFKGNKLLENNQLVFEISFDRSPLASPEKGRDQWVQPTILQILRNQFELQGMLPIYYFVCDMNDRRQGGRAELFNRWFESDETNDWELFNFELEDPQEQGLVYYAGLFVHREHPNFASIPDAFAQFLEEDVTSGKFIRRR